MAVNNSPEFVNMDNSGQLDRAYFVDRNNYAAIHQNASYTEDYGNTTDTLTQYYLSDFKNFHYALLCLFLLS